MNADQFEKTTLKIYHPNGRCTGSALTASMIPANGCKSGYILMGIAPQNATHSKNGERVCPQFDFNSTITVKLDLNDLSQFIMVFRGMQESILDGKGLFHKTAKSLILIKFAHVVDPSAGYKLDVRVVDNETREERNGSFFFNYVEATTFSLALEGAMPYMTFGVPFMEVCAEPEQTGDEDTGTGER